MEIRDLTALRPMAIRDLAALLVPPLCATCGAGCGGDEVICGRCAAELRAAPVLAGQPPPGLDACWSAAPHAGIARQLVFALKFRSLLPVAAVMAERLHLLAPPGAVAGVIVPVPTAPWRGRRRGFDPALELGRRLARPARDADRPLPVPPRLGAPGRPYAVAADSSAAAIPGPRCGP